VLRVTIPSSPRAEPRRIDITHSGSGSHAVHGGGSGGSKG